MAFITEIANYIKENYNLSKESLTIIFPNKRAALKLRTELINSKQNTNIWLPQILSIQEAMCSWSGLQLLDNIDIIFELIKILNNTRKNISNDIYGLASQMLKDFDEIDQYAVNAENLFQNTKDAKEIELNFNENYEIDKKYIEFFSSLNDYYESLRKVLLANNTGYYGLISRYIYELDQNKLHDIIGNRKIIFAGFNAMTKTEESIIVRLIQSNKATLLWDLDEYYFNDNKQEAGIFAREFFERNKNIHLGKPTFLGDKLVTSKKNIEIIGTSGAVIQTNALQLELHKESNSEDDNANEVIVLSDESLLIPVLNCIPKSHPKMQVTMGFPYSKTILNQFLLHLFAFQKNIKNNDKGIYFWSLSRLLNSELVKIIFSKEELKYLFNWKNELIKKSTYYITIDEYKNLDKYKDIPVLLCAISEKWNSTFECISSIKKLLNLVYKKVKDIDNTYFVANQISIAGRIINKIEKLIEKYEQIIQISDIETLYRQSSSEMTINLKGDYSGLQIMGLLETRNLDFKTVHILSVNEGILPQSKNANSLIPFDLRKHYGLPTYNNKQAVYAYHFYRLLQNAEKINIYYNTLADGMGEGEASRFIKQIIHEMPSKNPNVTIKEKIYKSPNSNKQDIKELEVIKTDEVYEKIINKLSFVSEEKKSGLSPTSISCYLTCPLKFYLQYIEKINDETPNELIQSNIIGTIIHATLENLYKHFGNEEITLEKFQDIYEKHFKESHEQALRDNKFPNGLPNSGFNYLSSKIMEKMIKNFIDQEIKFLKENKSMKIIGLEQKLFHTLDIPEYGTSVNLLGSADRIDQVGNTIRIIDYKSGSIKDSDVVIKKNVKELKDLSDKSLQLLIYKYLYKISNDNISPDNILPGILGLRKISKGVFSLSNNSEYFIGDNLIEDCESMFLDLFKEILNRDIPFKQTSDENKCMNCSFTEICKRNPSYF
jgi:CRISPR/Cas system-associated exonuclease Cas4 (RecB family)